MTWRRRIPRPSLMWMSIDDVMRVRNNIIGLYLAPGQVLRIARANGAMGQASIHMSASTPVFIWSNSGSLVAHQAWMRYDDKRMPYWDYQYGAAGASSEIERVPFDDSRVRPAALIVKHLSRYFPFISTDNYLVNGGKPIA